MVNDPQSLSKLRPGYLSYADSHCRCYGLSGYDVTRVLLSKKPHGHLSGASKCMCACLSVASKASTPLAVRTLQMLMQCILSPSLLKYYDTIKGDVDKVWHCKLFSSDDNILSAVVIIFVLYAPTSYHMRCTARASVLAGQSNRIHVG